MNSESRSDWAFTTQRLVLAAIFGALIFALYQVGLAFFPVPNVSQAATILHIVTALAGIIGGPIAGLIVGGVFAVVAQLSFGAAFPFFILMPARPLIGLVAWAVYTVLSNRMNNRVAAALAGVAGSLTNTVVTIGIAIATDGFTKIFETVLQTTPAAFVVATIPQAILEAVLAAVICPLVVIGVRQAMGGRKLPL
jgi:uncharacterized membrane protein